MTATLLFKEQDETRFWQYWREVLDKTAAGPRYSEISLRHWNFIASDEKILQADKSFILLQNGRPEATVYLPILKDKPGVAASIPGDFIYAPRVANSALEKAVFSEIDKIAKDNQIDKIEFQIDPLDRHVTYNYLQKYGYVECSILSYLIDLTTDDFLASCRKGHRYEIKKVIDDPNVEITHTDNENSDYNMHEEYRRLHYKMAGRVTRPKETFDQQFERLQAGEAVLFGLKYKGQYAALIYFDVRAGKACYASSVHDRELPALAFGHALIYKGAEYLKAKGVKFIDTEQPGSPAAQFGYYPTEKQRDIALFKRGFAGRFVQNFRGVKYFTNEAFEKDLRIFSAKYQEVISRT